MDNKIIKKHFSGLGFRMFWGTIITFAVQLICGAILGAVNPALTENFDAAMAASMIPMYLVGLPIMILLIKKMGHQEIEKKSMAANDLLKCMLIGYALIIIGNLFGLGVTEVIALIKGEAVINPIVDIVSTGNIWITSIYTVICAPIFEEIIFRKLLIERTVKYGEKAAVIFSGITFALFHGNLNQFVYAFILGVFLAFIYLKTGQLKYCIIIHMFINFMGSFLPIIVTTHFDASVMPGMIVNFVYSIIIFAMVIAGIVLLIKSRKKFILNAGENEKGKWFNKMFVNAGMILYSLFWIANMVIILFA